MNRALSYRLITDARRITRAVEKGNMAQWEAQKAIEKINRDEDHSDKWKDRHIAEITQLEREAYNLHGKIVVEAARRFMENVERARNDFDFKDPDFQAALNTLAVTGKATSPALQGQIVDAFAGNPGALDVLKKKFEALDFRTDRIDQLMAPFDPGTLAADQMNLTEFAAYSQATGTNPVTGAPITPTWKPNGVTAMTNRITRGLNLDTSSNPYAVKIAEMEENPADPLMRVRARRFLENNRAALDADDPATCERAEAAISSDFKSEGVVDRG